MNTNRMVVAALVLGAALLAALPPAASGEEFALFLNEPIYGMDSLHSGPAAWPQHFAPARRLRPVTLTPAVVRAGYLRASDTLRLNLFPDIEYTAAVDRVITNVNGTLTIRARVDDLPFSYVLISTTDNQTLATVAIPEERRSFTIQTDPATLAQYVIEVDADAADYLEDAPPLMPPDNEEMTALAPLDYGVMAGVWDWAAIDVMVVYTPAARDWAGGAAGIANVIAQAMEKAQLTLDNSNTYVNMNLVHAAEVNYTESGNASTDLNRLTEANDGYMDEVHTWRDQYGADLVSLFAAIDYTGGIAWQLNLASGRPAYGFNMVRVQQAGWTYTHIHELAHNMGCGHHKQQNHQPGPELFSYSAGWRWIGNDSGRYCSVMTYASGSYFPDGQDHTTVAYLSNPSVNHQGQPTGHALDGDNARTIREVKHAVAAYRPSVAPVTLSIDKSGSGQIRVNGALHALPWSGDFSSGANVSLEAVPDTCWQFNNWSGALTGGANPTTIEMNANKNVTANFTPASYMLNLTKMGEGQIKVNDTLRSLPWSGAFACGAVVTLEAVPAEGWAFEEWTEGLSGTTNPTTVTMNSNQNVEAQFHDGSWEIVIGDDTGTWDYPLQTYYHDARTQTIYLATEIGSAGVLNSLSLEVTQTPGQTMNNFTIRMQHTDLNVYAVPPSWQSGGWTIVYQAHETITATGWVEFPFNTPFAYNGNQSLLVDISFNNSSWSSNGRCRSSAPGGTRSLYYRSDSGYGDPLTWSGGASPTPNATSLIPNIKLIISAPSAIPGDFTGDGVVDVADLTWLAARWLQAGCIEPNSCDGADLNADGVVNLPDFAIMAAAWLEIQ